ncbi:acyl-CoA dehydrogenase family protein [Nocardia mexicana]|uniref:Acyl-[acyl-carrier-protein] dehydrogenase MbtN n=1 Tax=Nocardia mexicana TaxID=279262 RepID=A0A370GPR2_9NOCA|nr:acyl-CoA dehydrogenase family protein [Nocardia mexicana]RDI45369.1 acyl-CoA dehydrogenase [Nocardia mexicana]
MTSPRMGFNETHDLFREGVREFLGREVVPRFETWEAEGIVDKELFRRAGDAGYLAFDAPEEFGGGGTSDFRFNAILLEEACALGVATALAGVMLHNDVCLPYFLDATDREQKSRWLPGLCDGSLVTAVAMTEPGGGSDLASMRTTAIRDGDNYIINGSKTFISSAFNCDLVVLACKTNPALRHDGISLIVVEADRRGFERGRRLRKMGQHAADTGELYFNDVRVPTENLLGIEGEGFKHLVGKLPRERLSIAAGAVAQAESAFQLGLEYSKGRTAFGQPVGSFQANRFTFAEMRTEIDLARVFVDHLIESLNQRSLTAVKAAEAKWWATELCRRVVDHCLQIHGGYGFMEEYPIARLYRDVRISTIYGGTTEIMKEIIGRELGL